MTVLHIFKTWCAYVAIVTLINSTAVALEFAGGTGEPNNPYQINTAEQLISIGSDPNLLDKHFVLLNDIDLDPNLPGGQVFTQAVIAPSIKEESYLNVRGFNGSFNGNGCKIKNLTIRGGTRYLLGLFGKTGKEARILNLGLENVSIKADGSGHLGALSGLNHGYITYCYSNGNISCMNRSGALGGLIGENHGGSITHCYSDCNVSGEQGDGIQSQHLGGLVGNNWFSGRISSCYATGTVSGDYMVGGLVGSNLQADISNCYATGSVSGSLRVGGLCGFNGKFSKIVNCFSVGRISVGKESNRVGGLVGGNEEGAIIAGCFWNIETSGMRTSDGGTGLRTAQMMNPEGYSLNGWAGDPNWVLDPGKDYPRLVWEGKPGQTIPEPSIDWFDGSGTQEDPFIIASADQLARIGMASILWDKAFVLVSDLDFTDITVPRIGTCRSMDFTGSFKGNGHIIRNLTMDTAGISATYLGLFGYIGPGGWVSDLGLENVIIKGGEGSYSLGGLVGCILEGTISHCYTTGSVSAGDNGRSLGGLVGCVLDGTVTDCWAASRVAGGKDSRRLGGLVGYYGSDNIGGMISRAKGMISQCYATGDVSGADKSELLGGLVGYNFGSITNCYATGNVYSGRKSEQVGGLVGYNQGGSITNCYATGGVSSADSSGFLGGLVGKNSGGLPPTKKWKATISHSYFLSPADGGGPNNGLGSPLADEQVKQQASFVDWDFESAWTISEGKDYPRLRPGSSEPPKTLPPDLSRCTRVEIQLLPSTLTFFCPVCGNPYLRNLMSPTEKAYLKSLQTIVLDDHERIKAFANDIGRLSYLRPVVARIREADRMHFVCYHNGEHLTSFTLIAIFIRTEDGHYFGSRGFPSIAEFISQIQKQIKPFELRAECAQNLYNLGGWLDAGDSRGEPYPQPSEWCDAIIKRIDRAYGSNKEEVQSLFVCPGVGDGKWHYAMNPNCRPDSPPDTVLLFETKDGWNQHGGPELFTFDNHDPKGGCVLLNDGTVKFIP